VITRSRVRDPDALRRLARLPAGATAATLGDGRVAGRSPGTLRPCGSTTASRSRRTARPCRSASSAPLGSGEGVLLYTDGILDARVAGGRVLGEARLAAVVREHPGDAPARVIAPCATRSPATAATSASSRSARATVRSCPVPGNSRPVEPYLSLELPPDARAPSRARHAMAGLDGLLGPAYPDVALLVSELVTNGVRHADTAPEAPLRIAVRLADDRVRVEVSDQGEGFDHGPLPPDPTRAGGWGLRLVDEIADAWGVDRAQGTTVWFEIARAS
jgi:anti-sigma regulatory factor (Ser/Thr protein kinase)